MLRGDMDNQKRSMSQKPSEKDTPSSSTATANLSPVVGRDMQMQASNELPDMTTMTLGAGTGTGAGALPLSLVDDESADSSSATTQLQNRKYRLINTSAFEWR